MRLPVVPQISTKDGTSNKNARLTNCLKETSKRGEMAVVRPGLELRASAEGAGGGLTVFNDELVSVYGTTIGILVMGGGGTYGDWTTVPLPYSGQAAYADSVFMINDGTDFYTSSDGITWTAKNAPGTPGTYALGGGGNSFCAVKWEDGGIYLSDNAGSSWSLVQTLTGEAPFVIYPPFFVNGYFFLNVVDALGALALWRSSSGSSWAQTTNYPPYSDVASMFAGDGAGTLVAVRGDEWSAVSTDDGDTWALSTGVGAYSANWIAYGNGIFLVPSSLDSAVSSDGDSFSSTGDGPADVYGITFDGDSFVVTRFPGGNYAISPNGYGWTEYVDGSGAAYALSPFSANGTIIANDPPTGLLVLNAITSSITSVGTVAQGSYDFA